MGKIKFTSTGVLGNETVQEVHDDVLLYDMDGNRTVDPTTLDVGDKICSSAGCPAEVISAKEIL